MMSQSACIDVETTYSDQLFCRFYLFNMVYKNGKYYWTNLLPVIMLVCAMIAQRHGFTNILILAVGMGVFSPFFIRKAVQSLLRTQMNTFQGFKGRKVYTLRVCEDGFVVEQKGKESALFSWKELWRVYRIGNAYYLYTTPKSAYLLESSKLAEEDRARLLNWITRCMGSDKFRDRNKLLPAILRWEEKI